MLSQQDAYARLETAAAELKELSYEKLEIFARSHCMLDNWQSRALLVDGETFDVNTMICKLGRLHKRISVEMTVSAEGDIQWSETPCVYFERYKSGRLYVAQAKGWEIALFKAVPYAFLGVVAIALLALVWHVFLRGG